MMIPKHTFACLLMISSLSSYAPAFAASATGMPATDTRLGALEVKMFSHSYSRESEADRLARLEKFVFSGVKADGTTSERIARLASATNIREVGDEPYIPKRRPFADWSPAASSQNQAVNQADKPVAGNVNYPRVNELEQRLFAQTYGNEPIAKRLDRLEVRSFGRTSSNNDLAMRVDRLVSFVVPQPSLSPIRLASYSPAAHTAGDYKANFFGLTRTADRTELSSAVRGSQSYTVVDQIEYLENATFGRTRPNKTLQKRVVALEEKYYGVPKSETDKDLSGRVAQLWSVANTGNTRSQSILNRGA